MEKDGDKGTDQPGCDPTLASDRKRFCSRPPLSKWFYDLMTSRSGSVLSAKDFSWIPTAFNIVSNKFDIGVL